MSNRFKEEDLLRELRNENYRDTTTKITRQKEIEVGNKQYNYREVYTDCSQLINAFVELADICYVY